MGSRVGRRSKWRFWTFTDDNSVPSHFLTSLCVAVRVPDNVLPLRQAEISLNVTNPTDKNGGCSLSIGSGKNRYSPIRWQRDSGSSSSQRHADDKVAPQPRT